jgi:hypothetical protein
MEMDLAAEVVAVDGPVLHVRFGSLSIAEQELLTTVLYSPADSWLGWGTMRKSDNPLFSLGYIFKLSLLGLGAIARGLFEQGVKRARGWIAASATRSAGLLLLAALAVRGVLAQAAGSVSIRSIHTVTHLEVHLFSLAWWTGLTGLLARAPWAASIVAVAVAFLLALCLRIRLRELARTRLNS